MCVYGMIIGICILGNYQSVLLTIFTTNTTKLQKHLSAADVHLLIKL